MTESRYDWIDVTDDFAALGCRDCGALLSVDVDQAAHDRIHALLDVVAEMVAAERETAVLQALADLTADQVAQPDD